MNNLFVAKYDDEIPENALDINTTSRSLNWTKGLSPFYLGPIKLYENYVSKNIENAWQFSKVYNEFIDENNNIKNTYFEWAIKGWNDIRAYRYPMGKGRKPLFALWNNKRLGYIDARKKIYLPLYANALIKSKAFKQLLNVYNETDKDIYLRDFDGYNHIKKSMSFKDVINYEDKSMGHAFIIWLMLKKFGNKKGLF